MSDKPGRTRLAPKLGDQQLARTEVLRRRKREALVLEAWPLEDDEDDELSGEDQLEVIANRFQSARTASFKYVR